MTDKQLELIKFAKFMGGKITKRQAVDIIGHNYYCNKEKHTGDVISRMVKSGYLKRIKKGLYEVSDRRTTTVNHHINPDQLNLL